MPTNPTLTQKTILITGATDGIGKVAALRLAEIGATVTGVGRNPQKCAAVQAEIRSLSGNPHVEFLTADLSSQASIHQLATDYRRKYERLDVLLNNAGAIFINRKLSADGIEMTFALNHLGYFLLTNLLTDLLVKSAPSRVVVVSSSAHLGGRMKFDDLNLRRGFNGWLAYGQSKLANVLFTYELARRLQGQGVTANVLHPGFVATQLAKNNGSLYNVVMSVAGRLGGRTPEQGAQTSIYLASSPEVEGVTGKYFVDSRETRSSVASYDVDAARRLWEISAQMAPVQTPSAAP